MVGPVSALAQLQEREDMRFAHFAVNTAVYHPTYGDGVVTFVNPRRIENIAVKFENGGPQGFANDATNNTADLYASKQAYEKVLADKLAAEAARKVKQ